MPKKQSSTLIGIGIAVFVIGGALLFLVVHKSGSSNKPSHVISATTPTTTLAPGTQVYPATTPTTEIQFTIPKGDNAVDLQMDYFNGGGGYVAPGSPINIYAVTKGSCPATTGTAGAVSLVESNIKVLSVIGQAPAQTGQPGSFLLAVTPTQAEALILAQSYASLYFTLTTPDSPAVSLPPVSCATA